MSYLTDKDVFDHIRRAQADGIRCGIAALAHRGGLNPSRLRAHGIEVGTVVIAEPLIVKHAWEKAGDVVERLVMHEGCTLVYLLTNCTAWGDEHWTLAYAGEPVATVTDVDTTLDAGDTLDVKDGELWIESPAGSGVWHVAGVILSSVAEHLRRRGVPVA